MSILGERYFKTSNAIFCYGLSCRELAVYGYLRSRAGSKDHCWPSMQTIAACNCSDTTALECNWEQATRSDVYLKYIATRPRVERLGSHGLFGDDDSVELQKAAVELDSYTGNVWTHIISLKREDAARLGYDRASAWCDLLR